MADRFEYEVSKRPNYELGAAIAWGIGTMGAFAVNYDFLNASGFYSVVPPAMLSMTALRSWQARKQFHKNKVFTADQNIEFVTYEDLKKKFRDDALWLGKGFAWTPTQTQRLFDEFLRNPDAMQNINVSDPNVPVGAFWLHSLGDKEVDVYKNLNDFAGHSLISGVTGAGKTRTIDILIAQLLMRKDEPLIMIDPKNDEDARENMRKICEKEGRDFFFFHPGFPDKSVRIDALHSWARITQISDRMKAIMPQSDNDTFSSVIWNVLNAIAACLVLIGKRPSIVAFREYMGDDKMDELIIKSIETHAGATMEDWNVAYAPYSNKKVSGGKGGAVSEQTHRLITLTSFYKDVIEPINPNLDIKELVNIRLHDREHLQKLIVSLFPVLSMLSSGGLAELLSPTPNPDDPRPIVTTKEIVDNKSVLWIGLDTLSDQTVGGMIGSIILSDLTCVAGSRYNFGKGSTLKANIIVDESAEVINKPLVAMLNKSRGSGFRCFLLTQTLADFTVRLGSADETRMAIGNINNNIILRLKDGETSKYFAEGLPEVMVKRMGTQYQTNVGHNPVAEYGGRYGETMQEDYMPSIPPWAFEILPNLHYFGIFTGGSLIKARLPILRA